MVITTHTHTKLFSLLFITLHFQHLSVLLLCVRAINESELINRQRSLCVCVLPLILPTSFSRPSLKLHWQKHITKTLPTRTLFGGIQQDWGLCVCVCVRETACVLSLVVNDCSTALQILLVLSDLWLSPTAGHLSALYEREIDCRERDSR